MEEACAVPPAPPAAPVPTAGAAEQAGRGRPAGSMRAALAACAANPARQARAVQWQQPLPQLQANAPAGVPAAAGRMHKTEEAKEDAGKALPPPRAPSADSLGGASADSTATSREVRTLTFPALHDQVCHWQRAATGQASSQRH